MQQKSQQGFCVEQRSKNYLKLVKSRVPKHRVGIVSPETSGLRQGKMKRELVYNLFSVVDYHLAAVVPHTEKIPQLN